MSEQKNDGGPAFPMYTGNPDNWVSGLSLRDYFAAQALMGIVANPAICPDPARHAYQYADAMLREREK